jgi:hypothetical protein
MTDPLIAAAQCSVAECDRPYRCSGYCKLHHDRVLRLGTPHLRVIPETCTIDGCSKPHKGRGYCSTHWLRWRKHGDPMIKLPNPGEAPGALNRLWRGADITYSHAHRRVRRVRGAAGDRACVVCQQKADHWAYDHGDPEEKFEVQAGKALAYSAKTEHYQPMCSACHWRLDRRPVAWRVAS